MFPNENSKRKDINTLMLLIQLCLYCLMFIKHLIHARH